MSKPNDGGPAFPSSETVREPGTLSIGDMVSTGGMSLRDWFAGQAMVGWIAHPGVTIKQEAALWAYEMADAMLKVREERL